ncbi:Cyclic di-GMP phosphodiesterase Gmr [Poriferisphaera corsica]|uniref:Cyclic di-GMP phosphodiesterase Gmr n=1 Tax=Poriferisphaera corsica TaxID=2528020 RepID=A0A517YR10_9BACT|nr:diguanylate cyclase [Poriferisphaera corsica]QDU32659.1 Cyclic di-GMP phosphodiesterase Gmr [Poriferisphaera corsica]
MKHLKTTQYLSTRLMFALFLGGFLVAIILTITNWQTNSQNFQYRFLSQMEQRLDILASQVQLQLVASNKPEAKQLIQQFQQSPEIETVRLIQARSLANNERTHYPQAKDHIHEINSAICDINIAQQSVILYTSLTANETKWNIQARISTENYQQQLLQSNLLNAASALLVIFAAAIVIAYIIRKSLMLPFKQLQKIIKHQAPAKVLQRYGIMHRNEFGILATEISQLIHTIDQENDSLKSLANAHTDLYQNAPAALISIDLEGCIEHANLRATHMLGLANCNAMSDVDAFNYIYPSDRPLLKETLDRLTWQDNCRCNIRLLTQVSEQPIDVAIEAIGVYDELGNLSHARLSLTDISRSKELHRQLQDKTYLMNLVVDHMSDGILLINRDNKVAAINQRMCTLLQSAPEHIQNITYNSHTFWDKLNIKDHDAFIQQVTNIEADNQRPAQERFVSPHCTYLFQGIPVHDGLDNQQGRLWVVSESPDTEHNSRLINQHNQHLSAIKHMAEELTKAKTISDLLEATVSQLNNFFDVEAVGIAIRDNNPNSRTTQLINRKSNICEIAPNREIAQAVQTGLMPEILASPDFAYWPDLDLSKGFWVNNQRSNGWRQTFSNARFTSLAVGPLIDNCGSAQGIIWCAQRSGERFDRHEMLMIEMITPLIEARLEVVQMQESLQAIDLIDPITSLPNQQQFHLAAEHFDHATNSTWSLLLIEVDNYQSCRQSFSHTIANNLLTQVATLIKNNTRRSCFIANYQGPIFAILIPETDPQNLNELAERLSSLATTTTFNLTSDPAHAVVTSFSIGAASSITDGPSITKILARAVTRLDRARKLGRNHIVCTDPASISTAS